MVNLSTRYLGLELRNPLVPSASPLSADLDSARRLEDAGAGALVMHSLFEEKIEEVARPHPISRQSSADLGETDGAQVMANSYEEQYLQQLAALKRALDIPVIASLNGTTPGGWVSHAESLQAAGADALELNVYYIPAGPREDCCAVENRYVEVLAAVRQRVDIPITMKLCAQFSSPFNFALRLEDAGADGLVLFNRFYQPDIDLDTLEVIPRLALSTSEESLMRIRWLAILYGRTRCSLAITGGVHSRRDVLKSLLAGADVTHMCSALLRLGPDHIAVVLEGLRQWLEEKGYESLSELKGSVSECNATDSAAFLRANYVSVLDSYQPPTGLDG